MTRLLLRQAPLALLVSLAFGTSPIGAQTTPPNDVPAAAAARDIRIASQALGDALNAWARQTGTQLAVQQAWVAGKTAPAVSGLLTPRQALDRLLAGSGLVAEVHQGEVTIRRLPAAGESESSLAAVTVTAQAERSEATEGTGSYTSSQVSLGKGQSIREVPQSISVVTRQRIEDQNMGSIASVMQHTTGVTVANGGSGGDASGFYARGFEISSMQVDGAAVDSFSQNFFNPNLAKYDSVQVVRGADGLFAGTGEPGGSVNLVRKRPQATPQVQTTLAAGNWNQRRAELDATGPIAWDGKLRGRAVISHQERDFHYDAADARNSLVYGILETDLGPDTQLSFGGSYERVTDHPWAGGLPRAANGADLGLPRNTSLMAAWNRYDMSSREVFAQLDQKLAGDWQLKVQANYNRLNSYRLAGNAAGAIDPATGNGLVLDSYGFTHASTKKGLDVNANGSFDLLGRQHHLLVGGDWQDVHHQEAFSNVEFAQAVPRYNIWSFVPGNVPAPINSWMYTNWPAFGSTQKGLYSRAKLSLTDQLTAVAGARYSSFKYQSPSIRYDNTGAVTSTGMSGYSESGILIPYGGLVYDLNDQWTTYASVAEIHKSQANRLKAPLPGQPLDAITGRNYEIGAKGEFNEGRLTTAFSLYRIERNGQAVRDPSYPSTAVGTLGLNCCWLDQGQITSQGLDAEINGELAPGWQLYAGYTYNSNRNKVTNVNYHSITPRHLLRLWSSYRLRDELSGWTVGGGVNLQSAHFVNGTARAYNPVSGQFDGANVPFKFTQAGYAVWGASVQYRFDRHWTAALNLNNVFDKVYYKNVGSSSGGNWYGEPRNVMLTLRGTF
ncbi:TonB-dependent siderophore receptor [Hydrogenophaga palleronii]|uniref:TonB-dependent siderophore receptor n=1 Tax=Hydrogenophaga palleronii TaxID=65655 RepID=UPI00082465A7|nr:TonB-dependent siderophore receptor [Hydrogenophaga palleronii]